MAKRKEPSQKQKDYAASIAKALNIKLPEEQTSAAYKDFISKNQERFAQSRPTAVLFTDEQIARANAVDILDYARSMGLELKRDGKDYRVKNYSGGFIITPEKNNWNWFDGNQGGGVVQLCMFLENKTWQEAVGTLINEAMKPIRRAPDWKPKEELPKEFNLPPKNDTNKHVYAYLTKTRGIDAEIVKDMLDKGYIYENQQRSCVFVGRDNKGIPRHASVRSTNTIGKVYKKDVSGSQKKYSFSISGTSGNLNVFEAPIDALSHMSLQKMQGKSVNDSYVALGGVTDKALEQYLTDHNDIRQITVCTDGDEAGEKAAERIKEKYGADYEIVRESSRHKDFNEDLVSILQEENFRRNLHEVVAGNSRVSDSILIGKTPNILVACGATEGLDFTISKTVIDKCIRPEIRNADGKLAGKTGHGLTENQLYSALMNVKEPVMVLKGNRENSLVVITEYPDDKNRPIVVAVVLDKKSGRTMINNVSSVYGRDKFEEYIERQIQQNNILAIDNKKAESLLQPIGKWYPKRGEVISYNATIAYSMGGVKYPENGFINGDALAIPEQSDFQKIQEKSFAEQVDKVLAGTFPFYSSLKVCDTPAILQNIGCEPLPMLYTQNHLRKAILPKDEKEHQHGLDINQIKRLPDMLEKPAIIMDSLNGNDSIIVVSTELDTDNNPVLISIRLNGEGRYELENIESNFITSVYGRNQFDRFLKRALDQDKILYWNKSKSQELFERWGEQYSELTSNLDFNEILHQSNNIVKKKQEEKGEENMGNEQLDQIMKKLDAFAKTADDYEIFADEKFHEKLYHILQDYRKLLVDNPDGILTLIPKFYEKSNPNELDVESDLWNEFWHYLERYGVTGDERFSDRLNRIVAQPETKEQAFSIMKDIKEYLDNRLYMSSYMRGDVAVNEDIASYYMEKAYDWLNADNDMDFKDPERNQDMENQIRIIQKVFNLDDAASVRFYTTTLGGTGWGSGEEPYFYVTEDLQSSFNAAYASYLASDADGRVIGYSKVGMSTSHLVEVAACRYDSEGKEVHMLNHHIQNQMFDEDSKVLAGIEKKLYEELGTKQESNSQEIQEKSFAEQVDEVLAGTSNPYNALKVCDTPQLLLDVGCEQLPMLYTQQHLRDALKNKLPQNPHWHGLTEEQIKSIPDLLADPAIIFDSLTPHQNSEKSIIVVLNAVDNDNAPLIVSILPKGEGIYNLEMVDSNFITSIYGKDRGFENYINRAIENNSVLYWNKTKSQELFMFQGLQLPEAFNNLDFNRILHQSNHIVKENNIANERNEDSVKDLNKNLINDTEQTFVLTGAKVSLQMQDILERLALGEEVPVDEINNTKEIRYCRSIADDGKETYLLEGRQDKQNQVLEYMESIGSASGYLDENGKMIYDGDVRKGSRLDIVIGLPAAGKSSALVDVISQEFHSKVIDNDIAKKQFTEYQNGLGAKLVHKESQMVCERVLDNALANHENIVLPKVGSNVDKLFDNIITRAKEQGYEINVHFVDLERDKTLGRMLGRLISDGRFLDPTLINKYCPDKDYNRCEQTYEALKQNEWISGYSRWDNDVAKGEKPFLVESHNLTGEYINNARVRENQKGVVDNGRIGLRDNGDSGQRVSEDLGEDGRITKTSVQGVHEGSSKDNARGRREFQEGREPAEKLDDLNELLQSQEKSFAEQVDEILAGTSNPYNALKVCDTPQLLLDVGCEQLPLLFTQRHLKDTIQPLSNRNSKWHGLTEQQIKKLPELLSDPVMIYDSQTQENSIVVVTSEFDTRDFPVIVSVRASGEGTYELQRVDSNFITSVYGRRNFDGHITDVVNNGDLLYWNKQKSQELFMFQGLQLPEAFNNLDFNRILHQSNHIVKENNIANERNEDSVKDLNKNLINDTEQTTETSVRGVHEGSSKDNAGGRREFQEGREPEEKLDDLNEPLQSQEKSFAELVDEVLAGKADRYSDIKVCDTPDILIKAGCDRLPIFYTQKHLHDAIKPKGDRGEAIHHHGLELSQIKKLSELLNDPVMIYDTLSQTRNDSLVIVTSELDGDNNPIVVVIRPNGTAHYDMEIVESNFLLSVHGRNNFENQLDKAVQQDKVLYCNKQKSQELFSVLGLQLSQGFNNLDFDKIIHQSRNIVKENNIVPEPDISISNYESSEPNQVKFDVNIGENEVHKGEAAFEDDGTVNWVFVDPVPLDENKEGMEQQDTVKALKLDWDKVVSKVTELLQNLRDKGKEFMRTVGNSRANGAYTQSEQSGVFAEYGNFNQKQQTEAQGVSRNKNSTEQEKMDSDNVKAKETDAAFSDSRDIPQQAVNQYKDFAGNHKKSIGEIKVKHKPVVINAFGGPGSGKSTSCMDICQQLKKLGYNAEYVQEYAKELVYDKNWELLDGSPENQFEVLKEQLKRVDRLYNSGEVDFIVTDSPLLLNGVYNKSLTKEYDSMVTSLYNDFDNFTYFIERDAAAFQEEGRIHNLEESQKIDQDIKQLLEKKGISYETCNHDNIDKIVSNSVRIFNRLNHIEEAATKKQTAYAEKIAKTLDIKLPEEATKAAYKAFINENQEEFLKNNAPLREEGAAGNSYQDYLDMVTKNGSTLRDVPKEHYTDELLLSAVRNWGAAIRQIPEDRITAEIAMASVHQYGLNLKHVPEKLRNEEICIAAYISSSGKSVRYTPKSIKDIVKEEGQKRLAENNNAAPNSRRQIDTEQIQEQGQEWSDRIENMLMEHESDPDAMIEDIAFASKFYQYSTRNIQLMRQQNRGITYVASASAFEKMGYHVKAGEDAMIGRVPVFAKYVTNEKKERVYSWEYTPEIKQKLKEGTLKEQQAVRKFQFVAAFYDISQTDCPAEDYPSIFHMGVPSELHQEAFEAMKEFAEKSLGFKVMVTDLKSISLRGNCEPDNKIIRINDRLEATMALSTLCHEIAHGIIHTSENSAKVSAAQKECEADVMDIMLESSLGLSINGSRRDHFFNSFQKYKGEEAAKERPYKVTLEKLIDRVQSKVFRTYIEDINHYLNLHLPAEGSQNEAVTKEVVKNLALLDSAYDTDHRALINGENELFDIGRIESYKELYQQTREEYRLSNSFVPKLAVVKLLKTGKEKNEEYQQWDLWGVQLLDSETKDMILKQPEKITPEHLRHVNAGNILALKENVLSASRYYFVTEEGLQDMTETLQNRFTTMENKINCDFDMYREYECLLNLLENGIELDPAHMAMYEHICEVFDYSKNLETDSGMRLMARINLVTEGLSTNKRDLIAEYIFRTGNFEKAEKYAEQIREEPDGIKKLLQEMKLVNSYKYMLRTIAEYENNMDVPETKRITTGAYNTSGIPVLSKNVSSLSQINQSFLLVRKHASPESIKYYAIVEDDRIEDVYRIAYVELNDYQPEIGYSTVTFGDYEEAGEFYDRYLKTSNSRLVDGTQAEELVNLENKGNQIALSEITSIGKTIAAQKQQYKESGLSEERALEMLRTEISEEYPEISSIENAETGRELQTLKDFKKMVNYYGEERFIELSNLEDFKDSDVSLRLGRWLAEQKSVLDEMSITGIDDVKQCVDAALDCSVTATDIEKAFNAIDSAVLTSEFSNLETEFEGFEEYNNVLDTLKAAHVKPDKFCYVDFDAVPGPYLYTSDLAGNIYRKTLSSEWDDSVRNLSTRLKEAGYEICATFDDFRAYAANNRLGIFNVPEKEKNEAYIRILESTSDMLQKNQVLSVYDFKSAMDKLSETTNSHGNITYKLVTRKDQEIRSYIDTYAENSEQNVYEQLYGKAQEKAPELSKVISKQYYQDQLNFNENHLVRPLLKQLKQENKSVDDSDEFKALMDSNDKLKEEIKKLDLSPADAELLKLNAGSIQTEQIADIQNQQQMNQQVQQRKTRNQQMDGMSI